MSIHRYLSGSRLVDISGHIKVTTLVSNKDSCDDFNSFDRDYDNSQLKIVVR